MKDRESAADADLSALPLSDAEMQAFCQPATLPVEVEPETIEPFPEPVDMAELLADLMPRGWVELPIGKRKG